MREISDKEAWVLSYNEKIRKINEQKKEILSSPDYMLWLQDFIAREGVFCDDDMLYSFIDISDTDKKQIEKLGLLYEIIESYASKNYIYPQVGNTNCYFRLKYEDVGYKIGVIPRQGTTFYCEREDINKEEAYIDFNDIVNNYEYESTKIIKEQLDDFANSIISLYEKGIPFEAITGTFYKTVDTIENNKNLRVKGKILRR